MKRILLLIAVSTISIANFAQGCTDLYFSEYIEGSSNNKAFEIYNPTNTSIDLSNYSVELYSNGNTNIQSTLELTGTLAAGSVYVVANSSSTSDILNVKDTLHGVAGFSGNDAILLLNGTSQIDGIGFVGSSQNWSVGTGSTKDNTLVRKTTVTQGNTTWTGSADTEWDVYAKDDFSFLGAHTTDGCGTVTSPLVAGIILSEDTICLNTTISYNANVSGGTSPYSTSIDFGDGNSSTSLTGSHTYTTAGTYTLVYNASDDAIPSSTKDSTITVVVNSCATAPLVGSITLDEDTICLGTTINFTSSATGGTAPYSTEVYFGDGNPSVFSATGSYTYTATGSFALIYTVTDDAIPSLTHDSLITVFVDACLSIDEAKENVIALYPNPSKNGLVNLTNINNNSNVTVFNVIGEVVYSAIANNNEQLNLSNLNKGSYFVTIVSNNNKITKKLIIE